MRTFMVALVVVALTGCGPSWRKTTVVYDPSSPLGSYDVYKARSGAAPQPAVIFFHGGGFMTGSKDMGEQYAHDLCRSGFTVISADYRLTTTGPGWPAQIDDGRAVLRHVQANAAALGIRPRVAVMGASAGAMLALLLHLTPDPQGGERPVCCIDISGETDLTLEERCFSDWETITTRLLGESRRDRSRLRELSATTYARPDAHVLILHSTRDADVYVENADRMSAALTKFGADVQYCRYDGWAHGDAVFEECRPARNEIKSFLSARLGP